MPDQVAAANDSHNSIASHDDQSPDGQLLKEVGYIGKFIFFVHCADFPRHVMIDFVFAGVRIRNQLQ
jgi:hypothetical protein